MAWVRVRIGRSPSRAALPLIVWAERNISRIGLGSEGSRSSCRSWAFSAWRCSVASDRNSSMNAAGSKLTASSGCLLAALDQPFEDLWDVARSRDMVDHAEGDGRARHAEYHRAGLVLGDRDGADSLEIPKAHRAIVAHAGKQHTDRGGAIFAGDRLEQDRRRRPVAGDRRGVSQAEGAAAHDEVLTARRDVDRGMVQGR